MFAVLYQSSNFSSSSKCFSVFSTRANFKSFVLSLRKEIGLFFFFKKMKMNAQLRLAAARKHQAAATTNGGATSAPANQQQQQQQQQQELTPEQQAARERFLRLPPAEQQRIRLAMMQQQQQQMAMARQQARDSFLTEAEVDGIEKSSDDGGAGFRKLLTTILITFLIVMIGIKLFDELTWEEPGVAGAEATIDAQTAGVDGAEAESQVNRWYEILGMKGSDARLKEKPANRKESKEEIAERMRRNWEVRKELEKHLHEKRDEQNALVYCGQECQDSGKQVQAAYDALAARVERPLTEALFGEEDSRKVNINRLTDKQLREQYEKKKKEIEESTKENEEDKKMYLAELRDATEILQNSEAKRYYLMYNQKPPEQLKHVKATHGGWGQEFALKTFRNRLIMGWLQHLNSGWADYSVIALVIGIGYIIPMIFTIPKAIAIAEQMVDEHEKMEALEEVAKENAAAKKAQ